MLTPIEQAQPRQRRFGLLPGERCARAGFAVGVPGQRLWGCSFQGAMQLLGCCGRRVRGTRGARAPVGVQGGGRVMRSHRCTARAQPHCSPALNRRRRPPPLGFFGPRQRSERGVLTRSHAAAPSGRWPCGWHCQAGAWQSRWLVAGGRCGLALHGSSVWQRACTGVVGVRVRGRTAGHGPACGVCPGAPPKAFARRPHRRDASTRAQGRFRS